MPTFSNSYVVMKSLVVQFCPIQSNCPVSSAQNLCPSTIPSLSSVFRSPPLPYRHTQDRWPVHNQPKPFMHDRGGHCMRHHSALFGHHHVLVSKGKYYNRKMQQHICFFFFSCINIVKLTNSSDSSVDPFFSGVLFGGTCASVCERDILLTTGFMQYNQLCTLIHCLH